MDLFKPTSEHKNESSVGSSSIDIPLATRMRPRSLEEYAGQEHIIGEGKLLRRMIQSGRIGSMIFYGPPSSGKTTLANVISHEVNAQFLVLNAVLDGVKELREVVAKAEVLKKANGRKTILFVDEIHRWNKAQQDALLPHIESGLLTLIGATTENPFYSLVSPLLSRCQLFEMYPFSVDDILQLMKRALDDQERGLGDYEISLQEEALLHFAEFASGDIRNALNAMEMAVVTSEPDKDGVRNITLDIAKESIQKRVVRFAKGGDEHYHYASAFIKSLRGSDPDAALYWMCAMLEGGEDPVFLFRRMLIFASEDVGMAEPHVISVIDACQEAFTKCGMPEGLYFLSHACLYLALSPKSNSSKAIFEVLNHIKTNGVEQVPSHLKDKTANKLAARYLDIENASENYKYPHEYPHHWVEQEYLPQSLEGKKWYSGSEQAREKKMMERLEQIKEILKGK